MLAIARLNPGAPLLFHDIPQVEARAFPAAFALQPGDIVHLGHFAGAGMDLRALQGIHRYPTLLIFARGAVGQAAARALLEAGETGGLTLQNRKAVHVYVEAATPAGLLFQDRVAAWAGPPAREHVCVLPTVLAPGHNSGYTGGVGSAADAFAGDDIEYEADSTAAVVLGDAAFEAEMAAVLREAGLSDAAVSMLGREAEKLKIVQGVQV